MASQTAEEFREEQKQQAAAQNQSADNAVPEQRPQAFNRVETPDSKVQKRLRDSGALQEEPMPQSAHKKAASDKQLKKADKASQHESIVVGARVRITDGPYEGSAGAVVDVSYANFEETQKARSGDPAVARFAKVDRVTVRTRGGRHALVDVSPDEVEEIDVLGVNVSEA